jgi:hypothetical protein
MNGHWIVVGLGLACAAAPNGSHDVADAVPVVSAPQDTLVPAGYGTLRQDAITASLRDGSLLIKVTPLDEGVIRLLAPDTYRRMHALAENQRADAEMAGPEPQMFLVSFFSYQPNTPFHQENLQLSYQGRLLQPMGVFPLTTNFGRPELQQQESQSAIYVFPGPLDYRQPFVVRYGMTSSNDWARISPDLDIERAKVRARAGGG